MSKPGIEPSNNNDENNGEAPGVARVVKKKSNKGKIVGGLAALALAAFALSKCGGDDEQAPAPAPEQPTATAPNTPQVTQGPKVFLYRVNEDTQMRMERDSVGVKMGGCLEAISGPNGNIINQGTAVEVQGTSADGVHIYRGFVENAAMRSKGIATPGVACLAEFTVAAPAAVEATTGPVQQWLVSGSANLYYNADRNALAGMTGDGSCATSTGNVQGDLMQIRTSVNGMQRTYWTPTANYRAAPSSMNAAPCEMKLDR